MSEGLKRKGWVIIGSDDFVKPEDRISYDHAAESHDREAATAALTPSHQV